MKEEIIRKSKKAIIITKKQEDLILIHLMMEIIKNMYIISLIQITKGKLIINR